MSYDSPALTEIPSVVSPEDHDRLLLAGALDQPSKMLLYEEMIELYPNAHPYFLVRLAEVHASLRSGSIGVGLYRKAQGLLADMGIIDDALDGTVEAYAAEVDEKANAALVKSQAMSYYQTWRPTKQHRFPTNLPKPPPGHQEVKDEWQVLTPATPLVSPFLSNYMKKLAIDTNHLEGTFHITEESAQDLVRRGISDGTVDCLLDSALQDSAEIKGILNDTLKAYELLGPLVAHPESLDTVVIRQIHARLMKTCRFHGDFQYIAAGETRAVTRRTVILTGSYSIQCCPFPAVDEELEYICKMAKQWIKSWQNPFATASWIHLILVRCHPFEDGNGRLTRLLASIPLMRHGYPPISLALTQRAEYYAAINKAYDGDHTALAQCIFQGMRETIVSIKSL